MPSRCGPTPLSFIFISTFRVRFGSLADISPAETEVRFTPKSGRFTPNSDRKSGFPQQAMSALPPESGHVRCK
jgi:hypothetical protein